MPLLFYFKIGIVLFELMACITGFLFLRRLSPSFWKTVPFFLLFIVCCEIPGYYLALNNMMEANRVLYVFFVIPAEFLFNFWLIFQMNRKKNIMLFLSGTTLYLLSFIAEYVYFTDIKSAFFLSLSYTLGNLILLIFLFRYFFTLIRSEELFSFYKVIDFWVAAGLLVFWLGSFPYYGLLNLLWKLYPSLFYSYSWLVVFLNYLMYISFTIGFLCKKSR